MPIERYEVKTYEVDYLCDVCGNGHYRPTGRAYPTYPMKYLHKCSVCGDEKIMMGREYPYTETMRIISIHGDIEE